MGPSTLAKGWTFLHAQSASKPLDEPLPTGHGFHRQRLAELLFL